MDKSVISVNIFGNEYTIKGVAEPDYIYSLASYLNTKMSEVQDATGLKDVKKIAILAAINISDELFEAKKSMKENHVPSEQLQAIRNRVEGIIAMVDKEIPSELEDESSDAEDNDTEDINEEFEPNLDESDDNDDEETLDFPEELPDIDLDK